VRYNIYLNGKKIQESVPIQVIVPAPEGSGSFEYTVAAVDASSVEGAKSIPGTIKIFKLTAPDSLYGRMIGKKIGLNWDPVDGAVLYNIYKSMTGGKGFVLLGSIQESRYTDSEVEDNKKYFYHVTAKDAAGKESGPSPEVAVSTEVKVFVDVKETNVIGKRTREVFALKDNDFTEIGIVHLKEPYDVEPSPDRKKYYVSSVNTKSVLIVDEEGKFIREFGMGDPNQAGNFKSPYGIGVGPDGRVFVADSKKNNVQVFSENGDFERVFVTLKKEEWMKRDPRIADVDVDSQGNVYVLEYWNGAVIKYAPNGKEIGHFSKRGPGPNETGYTTSFKVIEGKIYVADGGRARVLILDQKGKVLKSVGQGGIGVGKLSTMGGFDVTPDGMVFFVDMSNNLVQVYSLDSGDYLFTLANEENKAAAPLLGPKAISVDIKKQRVYVAMGIVNVFRSLEMFGEPEEAEK
jgi:sugar lactone lactonase YvrE